MPQSAPVVRGETNGNATSRQCGGMRELLLPPGRGKAGMGVECRHSAGRVSTPSPTRLADRAKPKAWPSGRRVGSTGPKHVRPQPLPGGGSQNIGRADFGGQTAFHNAKRFVSHGNVDLLLSQLSQFGGAGDVGALRQYQLPNGSVRGASPTRNCARKPSSISLAT